MSRFCLDTSAYSHFQRGHAPAVELVATANWLGVPSIVLGELRSGFKLGSRGERNERELGEFLDHPVVETLSVDAETSRYYAEIVTDLRRAGTPVPTNDIWIAALAARVGVPVLTYDKHFDAVERVGTRVLDASS